MRASCVVLIVGLGSSSAWADTDKTCGALSAHAMAPFELVMDAPASSEIEKVAHPKYSSSRLIAEDFRWDVRITVPKKEELVLAKVKQDVIAKAKKDGAKLTWKAAAKTKDGYRVLYSTAETDGSVVYVQQYLRTIEKKKWLCTGVSEWADSHECLAKACESVRPSGG